MARAAALVTWILTLTALAACRGDATTVDAGDQTPTSATPTPPPSDAPTPDGLVLQVRTGGGFVPAEVAFRESAQFSLYADRRVVVAGPTTLEYPGRALPNLLTGLVGEDDLGAARAAARDAGVTEDPDLGRPEVADAPTTTFVLVDGDRTHRLDAYALVLDDTPGLTAGQREARQRLRALLARTEELGRAATAPYRADAVSVLVSPYPEGDPATPSVEPPPGEADWPLADLATGGTEHPAGRCLGFTGADAERVLSAADGARSNTRWRSGGRAWALAFRPELPGTSPCTDG